MVVVQPSLKDLTMNAVFGNEDLALYPSYNPRRLTETVAEICQRSGIPVINLYGVIADNDPESLYFKHRNPHWNAAGQALGAQVVVARLLEELQQRNLAAAN